MRSGVRGFCPVLLSFMAVLAVPRGFLRPREARCPHSSALCALSNSLFQSAYNCLETGSLYHYPSSLGKVLAERRGLEVTSTRQLSLIGCPQTRTSFGNFPCRQCRRVRLDLFTTVTAWQPRYLLRQQVRGRRTLTRGALWSYGRKFCWRMFCHPPAPLSTSFRQWQGRKFWGHVRTLQWVPDWPASWSIFDWHEPARHFSHHSKCLGCRTGGQPLDGWSRDGIELCSLSCHQSALIGCQNCCKKGHFVGDFWLAGGGCGCRHPTGAQQWAWNPR